jgi:dynein heavy chain
LIFKSKAKDVSLDSSKQLFAKETEEEVGEFKKGLVLLYKQYKEEGPSAPGTSLDDGLRLIDYYKEKIGELNRRKEELVLAEKLFNLDISNFPELVGIDVENKQLVPLYDLYREVKNTIKEYSSMLWMKLDAELLKKSFDKLNLHMRKKLSNNYTPQTLGYGVYTQLSEKITDFRKSIPLIEQLKNPSVGDRHWEKLVKLSGSSW